jgi:hypothetical protein
MLVLVRGNNGHDYGYNNGYGVEIHGSGAEPANRPTPCQEPSLGFRKEISQRDGGM